jgi:hypothetical protein
MINSIPLHSSPLLCGYLIFSYLSSPPLISGKDEKSVVVVRAYKVRLAKVTGSAAHPRELFRVSRYVRGRVIR